MAARFSGQPNESGWNGKGRQCAAASSRTGKRCRRSAMGGKQVCPTHGGLSPNGIAHPRFKTGRYSAYVPAHLRDDYEAARNDPELLSLRDDLALLETRKKELLTKLDGAEPPPWAQLRNAVQGLKGCDGASLSQRVAELESLLSSGEQTARGYEANWRELRDVIQDTAKASGCEVKRMETLNAVIPLSEVMAVLVAFLERVKERVPDPETRRLLQADWNSIVGAKANGCEPAAAGD